MSDPRFISAGFNSRHLPQPHFNRAAALQRLAGDESLYADMVQFFADDAPALLKRLNERLDASDEQGVARATHSLKGLAANFDALDVVALAAELEETALRGDLKTVRQQTPILEHVCEELIAALSHSIKPS